MTKFPSLGENTTVPDILKMSPDAGKALMELCEAVMRGPSALSPGERELISAYVSGINDCRYCHGVHSEAAKAFGIPAEPVAKMFDDLETAGFDEKLVPLLKFARKLTEKPAGITEEDAQAVYDAGWDEKALHDTIMVTCAFNFFNRMLEGHGVYGNEALYKERGPLLKNHGYLPLIRLLGKEKENAA